MINLKLYRITEINRILPNTLAEWLLVVPCATDPALVNTSPYAGMPAVARRKVFE